MSSPIAVRRLARFQLVTHDASRLAEFFARALGFRQAGSRCRSAAEQADNSNATITSLEIGEDAVDLLQFDRPGRPYPLPSSASDLCFQHFAIVVSDMAEAFARLSAITGWAAISSDGPQHLPQSSGGVTAFKFRDPEGHPLELLQFPDDNIPDHWKAVARNGICLGIDHSAVSVSDPARSIAFYRDFGLTISARTLNRGIEQARLDGLDTPLVDVVALAPPQPTPHLELLGYRSASPHGTRVDDCDVAATRMVFDSEGTTSNRDDAACMLRDPDGHRLVMMSTAHVGKASHAKS